MQNEEFGKQPTDIKHVILILLVLAALVVSSVNLAVALMRDDADVVSEPAEPIETDAPVAGEEEPEEPEFGSFLFKKQNYPLPFGAAEIEAYYTTVERGTSLDGSTPPVTCSALVITDGPELLMDVFSEEKAQFGTPPTVVIGSEDSRWEGINTSTKNAPVKLLVTLDPTFEGETVGCMSWPFSTFVVVE